jgi:hypothetical protein
MFNTGHSFSGALKQKLLDKSFSVIETEKLGAMGRGVVFYIHTV